MEFDGTESTYEYLVRHFYMFHGKKIHYCYAVVVICYFFISPN